MYQATDIQSLIEDNSESIISTLVGGLIGLSCLSILGKKKYSSTNKIVGFTMGSIVGYSLKFLDQADQEDQADQDQTSIDFGSITDNTSINIL